MDIEDDSDVRNRFAGLVSFIREQSGEYKMVITRDTLIEDDLGITGEEAADLIQNFSKKYKVDITGFNFGEYFNEERTIFLFSKNVKPF